MVRTIRCNGHLHEIGLNSKGQLHIPNHTKDELDRFVMMADLGNNPCKCAVVYDAWTRSMFCHDQIHELMQREKIITAKLANRLAKHQRKKRNWPDIDLVFATKRTVKDKGDAIYSRWNDRAIDVMAEYVAGTVYNTLLSWGYSPKLLHFDKQRGTEISYGPGSSYNHRIFCAHISGHQYISMMVGSTTTINNCTVYENTADADIPWRIILDAAELQLLSYMVGAAQENNLSKRKHEFEELARSHIDKKFGQLPKHSQIHIEKDKGTVKLVVEHPSLTLDAANRLIKHYRDNDSKVQRLLKHNRLRRALPFRYPPKPSRGLGALCPKNETDKPMVVRPVENETYGI